MELEELFKFKGNILLLGESGTGKSYLAQKIHESSCYSDRPFIMVGLSSLDDELLNSEIFGHRKGSFTGAVHDRPGAIKLASNGTLFLDEIGDLSLKSQKKLLMILEEKVYSPVGEDKKIAFRGRVIAATNKNILDMVKKGAFRKDLYYRLCVFKHTILPIREDQNKLERMINHFLLLHKKSYRKYDLKISDDSMLFLKNYSWPGNIRQIKNVLEVLVSQAKDRVDLSNLSENIKNELFGEGKLDTRNKLEEDLLPSDSRFKGNILSWNKFPDDLRVAREYFEHDFLLYQLKRFKGRVNKASKNMGVSKGTLIAKAKKYGINTCLMRALKETQNLKNKIS